LMAVTAAPFDAWAAGYDRKFTDRLPGLWLRESVQRFVEPWMTAGARVLEIGCGTGADALWMARRGCDVLATDISAAMLERTRERFMRAGIRPPMAMQLLDATDASAFERIRGTELDVVFSNFGAFNCHPDLAVFFRAVDPLLRPGGVIAVTLMGRFCLAETLRFCLRGDFRAACRRWSGRSSFSHAGERYGVWYHTPRTVRRLAGSRYATAGVYGIGALLPTSEGYGVCERWPRVFCRIAQLDRALARMHYLISDHYLLVLCKRE